TQLHGTSMLEQGVRKQIPFVSSSISRGEGGPVIGASSLIEVEHEQQRVLAAISCIQTQKKDLLTQEELEKEKKKESGKGKGKKSSLSTKSTGSSAMTGSTLPTAIKLEKLQEAYSKLH
ncbi:hypothetical protein ADUPG1_003716, partial [Aduncisulcus paluster]